MTFDEACCRTAQMLLDESSCLQIVMPGLRLPFRSKSFQILLQSKVAAANKRGQLECRRTIIDSWYRKNLF